MNKQIFKIQIPLDSNMDDPKAMAYNKDRSIEVFVPVTEELLLEFGEEVKLFYWAYIDENTQELVVEEQADWQDW